MKHFVYILISQSSQRFYIGQTQDLEQRLNKHNAGYVKSTKGRGPWSVHFKLEVESRSEAMKLERKLKNMKSKKRIEQWIQKQNE